MGQSRPGQGWPGEWWGRQGTSACAGGTNPPHAAGGTPLDSHLRLCPVVWILAHRGLGVGVGVVWILAHRALGVGVGVVWAMTGGTVGQRNLGWVPWSGRAEAEAGAQELSGPAAAVPPEGRPGRTFRLQGAGLSRRSRAS